MKVLIPLFILVLTTVFACTSSSDSSKTIDASITETRAIPTEEDTTPKPVTVNGNFRSLQGVMHAISTKCYKGGQITLEDGSKVAVCFQNIKEEKISCKKISVTGVYTTIKDMEFLDVTHYECLD